jgi:hypothetical protein
MYDKKYIYEARSINGHSYMNDCKLIILFKIEKLKRKENDILILYGSKTTLGVGQFVIKMTCHMIVNFGQVDSGVWYLFMKSINSGRSLL